MLNNKSLSHLTKQSYSGRMSNIPPRCPLPSMIQASANCGSSRSMEKKYISLPKEYHPQNQRSSSESFFIEEQPAWVANLFDEPETPAGRGIHQRSSSDSAAYKDISGILSKVDNICQDGFKTGSVTSVPLPGSLDLDLQRDAPIPSFFWDNIKRLQDQEWLLEENQALEKSVEYDSGSSEWRGSVFVKSFASVVDSHDQKEHLERKHMRSLLHLIQTLSKLNSILLSVHGFENFSTLLSWKGTSVLFRLRGQMRQQNLHA